MKDYREVMQKTQFYGAPVSYFEVSFTLPNPKNGPKIKANFIRELEVIFVDNGLPDVLIDASYGKDYDYIHFSVEFYSEEDYKIVREDLFEYLEEHS